MWPVLGWLPPSAPDCTGGAGGQSRPAATQPNRRGSGRDAMPLMQQTCNGQISSGAVARPLEAAGRPFESASAVAAVG